MLVSALPADDLVASFLHAELAHFAIKVGAVQAEQAGGFGHVSLHSLDRPADVFLLELVGRFGEATWANLFKIL